MSDEIARVVALIRDVLGRNFDLVPTPSGKGTRKHAEVWTSKTGKLPLAFEDERKTMANLWLLTKDVPTHLPQGLERFDRVWNEKKGKWGGEDETDGANHNLIYYPEQFAREPITRLRVRTVEDAKALLDKLMKSAAFSGGEMFVLKINGEEHAPGRICRPSSSGDWNGGTISLPKDTLRVSFGSGAQGAPTPKDGDSLYIWTHEGKEFGYGKGLTATAKASDVTESEDAILIRLDHVELLPKPFGLLDLKETELGTPLLSEISAKRRTRIWHLSPENQTELDALIDAYGSAKAAMMAEAQSQHLSDLDKALTDQRQQIDDAEEERKTAVVKARPNQQAFRKNAMERHKGRCVVTGVSLAAAVEAAHVIPHTGDPAFEVPENSLILRRDIHALFDARLIAINPKSGWIVLSPELDGSPYEDLAGRKVDHKLAPEALIYQFRRFQKVLPTDPTS